MEKKMLFMNMTLSAGGAERVITNLANRFVCEDNLEIKIATFLPRDVAYELNDKIEVFKPSNDKKNIFNLIKNSIEVINFINKYKPNYIISFCPTACFFICFYRLINKNVKNSKLIISERNNPQNEYKTKFLRMIANFLYGLADVIVFQTQGAREFFSENVRKKGVIISNPLNNKFLSSELNHKIKKEKAIVAVGRLHNQKNYFGLINAFKHVSNLHPEYFLNIYGEGELKNSLIDLVNELEISDKVIFRGVSNNLEIEIPKNEIFVLNSFYEGMPNALMEAMALGVPCVATDCPCGGPRELIQNYENGILIPVDDEKELIIKLEELICDEKLRIKLGENASKIVKEYNPDNIYSLWKELIN